MVFITDIGMDLACGQRDVLRQKADQDHDGFIDVRRLVDIGVVGDFLDTIEESVIITFVVS